MRGLFITVEGVEGSGKTTVVRELMEWLQYQEIAVKVTQEPAGTAFGECVREILVGEKEPHPLSEAFLFLAARADHVAKVIRPALEKGVIVLCDRFTDSTLAYQSFGLGLSLDLLEWLNDLVTDGLKPDLTLLLDVDPEFGLRRVQRETAFERRPLSFHHRVRWGYLWLAKREPNRFKVIDANQPLDLMIAQAKAFVEEAIDQWRWRLSSEMNMS